MTTRLQLIFPTDPSPVGRNEKLWLTPWGVKAGAARRFGFFGIVLAFVGMATSPQPATAQDSFEIEVYGYETAARGKWELDTHLNYIARGTTSFDGSLAPTQNHAHLAFELSRGLTDHWEVTAYLLAAYRPGGFEYAGWRARTRVRLPESWRLPVDVSLAAELEFSRPAYDESAVGLEFRPIEVPLGG